MQIGPGRKGMRKTNSQRDRLLARCPDEPISGAPVSFGDTVVRHVFERMGTQTAWPVLMKTCWQILRTFAGLLSRRVRAVTGGNPAKAFFTRGPPCPTHRSIQLPLVRCQIVFRPSNSG